MKYNPKEIPAAWQYCFNHECPMRQECLRYQSGLEIPDDKLWGNAVYPTALKDGQCQFFRRDEKVRLATGFVVVGRQLQNEAFVRARQELTDYLGGNGTYYLYRNGKRWLTPNQQQHVERILRKNGYQDEVVYAKYLEEFNFS